MKTNLITKTLAVVLTLVALQGPLFAAEITTNFNHVARDAKVQRHAVVNQQADTTLRFNTITGEPIRY